MYGIEYWCGAKFGGWFLGAQRFPTLDAANASILANLKAEREREITSLFCRARAL